jgi:tRNA (guanine37-N1)-methyltransferase
VRFDILTLFPKMFEGPFDESIVKRAVDSGLVSIFIHNIRDFTHDKHRTVDDSPYGGGSGMLLKPEPLFEGVEAIRAEINDDSAPVILLTPQGRLLCHEVAQELSTRSSLILICGRYEGVDERVREHLATDAISIGEYVLTGGELAAMVVMDAVARLLPGVLGSEEAARDDSYSNGLLEYPQYTRPAEYRGWRVPEVLLSGNHQEIARWRGEQAIKRTLERRAGLPGKAGVKEKARRS